MPMEGSQQPSTHPDAVPSAQAADLMALGNPAGSETAHAGEPTASDSVPAPTPVSVYARAMLDEQIARLTHEGYVIVNRTDTSAQLKRHKHFSIGWAFFWLIVGAGVGLLVYIAWYVLVKRDRVAFVRVTPEGRVMLTES